MPGILDILNSLSEVEQKEFYTKATSHMEALSIDRYTNAFENMTASLLDEPTAETLSFMYLQLLADVSIENNDLNILSIETVNLFSDELFMLSCIDLLDGEGNLKAEIKRLFTLDSMAEKVSKNPEHEDDIKNLLAMTDINKIDAATLIIRNGFLKGYVAQLLKEIFAKTATTLSTWLIDEQNQFIFQKINKSLIQRFNYLTLIPKFINLSTTVSGTSGQIKAVLKSEFFNNDSGHAHLEFFKKPQIIHPARKTRNSFLNRLKK